MSKQLTLGKIRGLQQIASRDGIFAICAMDHRESLQKMLYGGDTPLDYAVMVEHKLELCATLAPHTSAVLLDPNYGAAHCISKGVLPRDIGLLVSLENAGYSGTKEERITTLLSGWGVEKIKRMGGSAVKLLVYYRPDLKKAAAEQLETIKVVAEECIKYDIPFVVEPKSYSIRGEEPESLLFAQKKPNLVVETALQVTELPVDVLKAEFPGDLRYERNKKQLSEWCSKLSEASTVPWVVLSAGVDFDTFYQEVEIACRSGASGFLGGRAVWQEAMHIADKEERLKYLSTVAVDRLKRLTEIATRYAVPWYQRFGLKSGELITLAENWYKTY